MDNGRFTLDDTGGSELGVNAISPEFLTGDTGDNGNDNGGSGGSDSGELDANGERWDARKHSEPAKRNADGSWRRKRGRGASSASSARSGRKAHNQAGIEAVTRALAIVHLGISKATQIPEIELDDEDAHNLGEATVNVLNEFDIRPDPKIEAIFGLIVAAGSIYAPKYILYRKRIEDEKNLANAPKS